jgi:predicted dehydrogenase
VALCDLDPDRLAQAGALAPGAKLYRDAPALFGEEALDFVEICTRPESHPALVAQAAAHGVHVLCQKPAAQSRSDFLAMIRACERAGTRLMIHENWRFRPWYRVLRAILDARTIGRPIRLRLSHSDTRALRPDGFHDQPYLASRPQLILFELGCHPVDTARYLMGEIRAVSATLGHFGGYPGEDVATLQVHFESGSLGLLDMSWCAPADLARPEWALNETVVEGTMGTLKLQTDGSLQLVHLSGERDRIPVPLPPDDQVYVAGYVATQTHFVDGLRHHVEHETSAADNLRTMDVVWTAYRSAEQGRTIALAESAAEAAPA